MDRSVRTTIAIAFVLAALLAIGTGAVAAEEEAAPAAPAMMGRGMGMMDMCPMCCRMMGGMMGRSAVAATDDGVYVLAGNKLTKYDRDLNLQKEAEIKMDMTKMQQKMRRMMEKCPMRKRMMPGEGTLRERMGTKKPGMGMEGMCPMHHAMMGGMMGRSAMVAADDGVYVLAGDKLTKYDRDLNLQKEAEVKMDMAKMQEKMKQMMGKCPMCKRMMRGGMMGGAQGGAMGREESVCTE